MRKRLLALGCFASVLFLTYSSSFAADLIKLKFANYFPPTHKNSILMDQYCKELNKKLAGKVEISYYTGGTLLTAPKVAAGIAAGIADIGLSHATYTRGRFPVMEIMELPLGFPSSWVATHAANDFYNKFKPKEWEVYHPLMFSTSPPCVVQTLTKPVKTLEDVKGLKIRATGRIADITNALGATPMPLEMVDVYEALRRGVLEGNLGNFEQMKGFKIGELLKYNTASWKISSVNIFYVVVNKGKWAGLPADVQKTITDYTRDFLEDWAISWNNIEIEGREFFLQQGGQILPLTDAEAQRWVKAVEPVIADYKKDMISKGYKATEVDSWISFLRERIEYWKGQEKTKKIPTAYQY